MSPFKLRQHWVFPISISSSIRLTFFILPLILYLNGATLADSGSPSTSGETAETSSVTDDLEVTSIVDTETSPPPGEDDAEPGPDMTTTINEETSNSLLNKLEVTLEYSDPGNSIKNAELTKVKISSRHPIRRNEREGANPTFSFDLWGSDVQNIDGTVLNVVLTLQNDFEIKKPVDIRKLLKNKKVTVQVKGKESRIRLHLFTKYAVKVKGHGYKFTVNLINRVFDGQVFFLDGLRGTQKLLSQFVDDPAKPEVKDNPGPNLGQDPTALDTEIEPQGQKIDDAPDDKLTGPWYLTVEMTGLNLKLLSIVTPPVWAPLQFCYHNDSDLISNGENPEKELVLKVQKNIDKSVNVPISSNEIFHGETPLDPLVTFNTPVTIGYSMYHHIRTDGIRPFVHIHDFSTVDRFDFVDVVVHERIKEMASALHHISNLMYYQRKDEQVVSCKNDKGISQMFNADDYIKSSSKGSKSICKVPRAKFIRRLLGNKKNNKNIIIHIFALDTLKDFEDSKAKITTTLNGNGSIVVICTSGADVNQNVQEVFKNMENVYIYDSDDSEKYGFEQIIDRSLGYIPMAISKIVKKMNEPESATNP